MPVFMMEYHQDTILYDGQKLFVELPENLSKGDKAFGFVSFKGNLKSPLATEVLIFLDDYKDYQGKLYIDKNFNLDLTDDGAPYIFNDSTDVAKVELRHSQYPQAIYAVDFQYIRYKNSQQGVMASRMKADNFPNLKGNKLIDHNFWLTETRNKYLVYKEMLGSDSVTLALVDENINGLFNEVGEDKILIAETASDLPQDRPGKNEYTIGDATPLSINGKYFKLEEVSPDGRFVKLSKSSTNDYTISHNGKLIEGVLIPDLRFDTFKGEQTTIHNSLSKDKLTLVDFWATWCKGCLEQTERLKKIDSLYGGKLHIVGLNFDPKLRKAKEYVESNNIKWPQGIADKEIVKSLSVDGFPFYILVNQDKTIHSLGIRLDEVEKIINEN